VGQGLSAAIYATLAWSFLAAMDGLEDVREGEGDVESFRTVLALPYGDLLLSGVGVAIFLAGALNLLHGLRGNFRRHLTGDGDLHNWTIPVARAGYSARGLVFLAVGFFLVEAPSTWGRCATPPSRAPSPSWRTSPSARCWWR
jgi:hypothetical protein